MSNSVMDACWPLKMPPTPKAVLISLADNANDAGHCWPSLTKISERTCFGRTAVIEAIKWLEENGAIQADRTDRYRTTYIVTPSKYSPSELVREANQSARRTSSSDGALVRLADDEVRETDDEVRQADTNHQEPSRTITKSNHHSLRAKVADERFTDFWIAYPRKDGKKAALKAWASLNPSDDLVRTILDALALQSKSPKWLDRGGQFIPHASTYLNGERWLDPVHPALTVAPPPNGKPPIAQRFADKTYHGTPDDELPDFLRTGTH